MNRPRGREYRFVSNSAVTSRARMLCFVVLLLKLRKLSKNSDSVCARKASPLDHKGFSIFRILTRRAFPHRVETESTPPSPLAQNAVHGFCDIVDLWQNPQRFLPSLTGRQSLRPRQLIPQCRMASLDRPPWHIYIT